LIARLTLPIAALVSVAGLAGCAGSGGQKPTTLSFPFPLGSLSADGSRVAVAPLGTNPQLGGKQALALVSWDASSGKVARLPLPRTCGNPIDTSLAGSQVAVVCDESCCDTIAQRVVVLRESAPVVVLRADGGYGVTGSHQVGALVGNGALLVFDLQEQDAKGRVVGRTLYRVEGTKLQPIAHGLLAETPLAVANGRIVNRAPRRSFRILRGDGRQIRAVGSAMGNTGLPARFDTPVAFDGSALYEADPWYGEFEGDSVRTGRRVTSVCQIGRGSLLGGVSNRLVAYTTADAVHVLRTSDCRDAIFGLGHGVPTGADITPAGLFYAANARQIRVEDSVDQIDGIRSSLTFVPMKLVLRALERAT
jgi:hypothetical protein